MREIPLTKNYVALVDETAVVPVADRKFEVIKGGQA